jgi:hypothetical protein
LFHRLHSIGLLGPDERPAPQPEPILPPDAPVSYDGSAAPAAHPEAAQADPPPEAVVDNIDLGLIEAGGEGPALDHIL